jgi:hypothetical protein
MRINNCRDPLINREIAVKKESRGQDELFQKILAKEQSRKT